MRVLLAEDSPADAEMCLATLKRAGFKVAGDVVEMPDQFEERLRTQEYDIILSDYNLRTWTGLEAFKTLQLQEKDIPFILVTGTLGDEKAVEAIKQGISDCVLKDNLTRLPMAVERALAEHRYRMEAKAAAESQRRLLAILEATPDLVALADTTEHIVYLNNAGRRMLEIPEDADLSKTSIADYHPEKVREVIRSEVIATALRQGVWSGETILRGSRGREVAVWQIVLGHGAPHGSPEFLSIIARDLTERKALEERLRLSQKLEAIGQLAGGVAHDFNNLLGVIIGYSDLLLEQFLPTDSRRKRVEQIRKAGDSAASITRQLLAFGRKQLLEPKVLDLNSVVGGMKQLLGRLIAEDIELVIAPSPELGSVKADPVQIEQIILNLAVNASDAMPRGGKLIIETANAELDEGPIKHPQPVQPGPYVMLAVNDTGVGMDAGTQARIFEPFFTTKDKDKGTGLGLATVYGIVKQSDGYIWVYSEPGKGTTFKIYLPRVEAAVEARPSGKVLEALPRGTETVLLVEDSEPLRELSREFLEGSGYTVLEAKDGADAVQVAQGHRGPIHLLLTDVVMPRMSGPEFAKRLTCLHPEAKVLYVCGYTNEALIQHGVLEERVALLPKPFTRQALISKVHEVLDGTGGSRSHDRGHGP